MFSAFYYCGWGGVGGGEDFFQTIALFSEIGRKKYLLFSFSLSSNPIQTPSLKSTFVICHQQQPHPSWLQGSYLLTAIGSAPLSLFRHLLFLSLIYPFKGGLYPPLGTHDGHWWQWTILHLGTFFYHYLPSKLVGYLWITRVLPATQISEKYASTGGDNLLNYKYIGGVM